MIEIIPAIDLIDGKCVRLTQGDYSQKIIYNEDPLEVAKMFEEIGIRRLHLVDLDGAKKSEIVNLGVLERIASHTSLMIDFGGGIKTEEMLGSVFDAGAAIATVGSIAVKNNELFLSWLQRFGAEKILLGTDVKDEKISIAGWIEKTDINVFDFIEIQVRSGVKQIFCTDIAKDGLLQGPSVELYQKMIDRFSGIQLIASGGVSKIEDVEALEKCGCKGVIIGKAFYEKRITLKEIKRYVN